MTNDDSALLRRYAENHDETAFAELVQRYLNLVYFAALRQVGHDAHRAEDVTQAVFTQFARKASSLVHHQAPAGWLHTTTRFISSETMRAERRRSDREQEAHVMENLSNDPSTTANWEQLRPVIDDTLNELGTSDREVVLLRFFAGLPHAQIGQKLNLSENTARMRVDRALEKLRTSLVKRGITSTAAALGTVLANQALASAPAGLAASTTSFALSEAARTAAAVTTTTAKIFSIMSSSKTILGAASIVTLAASVATWHQFQANMELRHEVSSLRQQATSLQSENLALTARQQSMEAASQSAQNDPAAMTGLTTNTSATPTANKNTPSSAKPLTRGSPEHPLTDKVSADLAAKKCGSDTPGDSARTLLWYLQGGNIKHAAELLLFEPAENEKLRDFIDTLPDKLQDKYDTPAKLVAFVMSGSPRTLASVQLVSESQPDAYTAIQHVRMEYQNGEVREDDLKFHRDVSGWKQVVSAASVDRIIGFLRKKQ